MIAIIDYGVGNLFSLRSSLQYLGAETVVSSSPEELRRADKLILPGVGAFEDASAKLFSSGLAEVVREQAATGKPIMGICLGMQLLFEKSYEYGEHNGLGLLKGKILSMEGTIPAELKIPHIGWNGLHIRKNHFLLRDVKENDCVYFVHSFYAAECDEIVTSTAEYGRELTASVADGNVMGCQFHPEKSGDVGMRILRAFCEGEKA